MGLLRHDKLLVGFDLGEEFSQISYCADGSSIETVSLVAGAEVFNIPTVLCKRTGVNQWYYGREAQNAAQENRGVPVRGLVQKALDGEPVLVDGTSFDPVALLTLFVKRSLGLLSQVSSPDHIAAMTITCGILDKRMLEVLEQVTEGLRLKTDRISYQDHTESFYHYMLRQPEELMQGRVCLLEYRGQTLRAYCMECNRRTEPVVVYIDRRDYEMTAYEPMPESEQLRREKYSRLDEELAQIADEVCRGVSVSGVYLIGEHYSGDWMKNSLRILCRGRHVFQGSNLFSKGACGSLLELRRPSEAGSRYVFLGNEKLKYNIGMQVDRRGQESYQALLDAGVNWFEAEQTTEFYVRGEEAGEGARELTLRIVSLVSAKSMLARMTLDDLPAEITRLRLHVYMTEENRLAAEVTDLGFGMIRPAAERVWREEFEL